jgi:hypothetical protein
MRSVGFQAKIAYEALRGRNTWHSRAPALAACTRYTIRVGVETHVHAGKICATPSFRVFPRLLSHHPYVSKIDNMTKLFRPGVLDKGGAPAGSCCDIKLFLLEYHF